MKNHVVDKDLVWLVSNLVLVMDRDPVTSSVDEVAVGVDELMGLAEFAYRTGKGLGQDDVVCVDYALSVTAGLFVSELECSVPTLMGAMVQLDSTVDDCKALADLGSGVGGAVVDQNYLEVLVVGSSDGLETVTEEAFALIDGDDNGEQRLHLLGSPAVGN